MSGEKRIGRIGKGKIKSKTPYNDRLAKPGEEGVELLIQDDPVYQAKVRRICDMIIEGMRSNEIFAMLMVEEDGMTEDKFLLMQKHAYALAENELQKDREYVFQLHMERYEDLYEKNMQMVNSWNMPLDPKKDWHIMVAKYGCALKALKSKEDLLGLHDKNITIEFNQYQTSVTQQPNMTGPPAGYDIGKLDIDEKKELLELIKEARTVPIEGVHRVIIKKTVIDVSTNTRVVQEEIQDIEYEEMPDNVVSKMQDITPKQEGEEEYPESPIVVDEVPKDASVKNEMDLKKSINDKLLQSFKEKLKQNRGS